MGPHLAGRLSLPVALGLAALVLLGLFTAPGFRSALERPQPEAASSPDRNASLEELAEGTANETSKRESVPVVNDRSPSAPTNDEDTTGTTGRTVLTVTAHDQGSEQDLIGFTVLVRGEGIGTSSRPAANGTVTLSYELEREITAEVRLIRPEPPMPVSAQVVLRPGEDAEARLVVPSHGELHVGQVVDNRGMGIEGALVFFGDEASGRHEPFAPFREDWVMGVRSGAGGWFQLVGDGPFVTAVHEQFSSATAPTGESLRLILFPRATIRGRLVDAEGEPMPAAFVSLGSEHRGEERTTDEEGRFEYTGLESGAHALWLNHEECVVIRLIPGEVLEADFTVPVSRAKLHFEEGGEQVEVFELYGQVIGLQKVSGVSRVSHWRPRTSDPNELKYEEMPRFQRIPSEPVVTTVDPVPDGRYLLVTAQGWSSVFELEGGEGRVPVGQAPLAVAADPGARLQVLPANLDTPARRSAADYPATIPESGEFTFRVTQGTWVVVGYGGRVLAEVQVGAGGARVEL